ncbi:hypothetical protein P8452_49167 [Trifolium repens]|nr:hypothetical protein P8452_49167 [Trifolium repens]
MQLAMLSMLKEVSFANNYLSGPVPLFSRTVGSSTYVNNSGLCGVPLRPCPQKQKTNVFKAHELGKYVCSIVSRRTHVVVNQVHEYLQPWLEHKESKEISVLLERLTSTIWLEELRDATDCFAIDNAIGVGNMGMM